MLMRLYRLTTYRGDPSSDQHLPLPLSVAGVIRDRLPIVSSARAIGKTLYEGLVSLVSTTFRTHLTKKNVFIVLYCAQGMGI